MWSRGQEEREGRRKGGGDSSFPSTSSTFNWGYSPLILSY